MSSSSLTRRAIAGVLLFFLAASCASATSPPSDRGGNPLDEDGGPGRGGAAGRGPSGGGGADGSAAAQDVAVIADGRVAAEVTTGTDTRAAADVAMPTDQGSPPDAAADGLASADSAPVAEDPGALAMALATKGERLVTLEDPRTQGTFPEGVSWRRDGSLFVCASKLTRIAPDRKKFHYLNVNCLGTYGLSEDRLLVAGAQGLYLIDAAGKVGLLAEAAGANDVSVDRQGRVYFTSGSVRRVWPDGTVETLGSSGANGVEIDPTDRYVYVTLAGAGSIVRHDIPARGATFGAATTLFTGLPTPDGLTVDAQGRLWVALHASIEVGIFDPTNKMALGRIKIPLMFSVQNLAFGGDPYTTLYVVGGRFGANSEIWRYPVGIVGFRNPGAASYRPVRMLAETAADMPY